MIEVRNVTRMHTRRTFQILTLFFVFGITGFIAGKILENNNSIYASSANITVTDNDQAFSVDQSTTGIRLGELCALTWNDIDFTNGILHIVKTLQRIKNTDPGSDHKTKMIITPPKSQKSIREIPLPAFLLCILESFRRQGEIYILSGTSKYTDPRAYQDKFKQYLKNADINPICFHALRHTFATMAIENGFDYKSLSELLGHSTVKFTMERYVHSSRETKRANMERFASCF